MALSVLKKTPIHAVCMVTGSGATTIILATDLVFGSNNTPTTPVVNIGGLFWSVPGTTAATIVRNSVTQWELLGAYHFEFNGWSDINNNTYDIVVTLPSGGGTVILELLKIGGFGGSQQTKNVGGDILP